MQELHSMGGARFFGGGGNGGGGGGGGVDRRLRPHHHHQALKCPRCDSINTKFCYYNNYNLSQPRHFCKNCRRYWTKGGVLRNVPVGGGCRKPKRGNNNNNNNNSIIKSPKKNNSSSETPPEHNSNNSHSSSESSSLTATTEAISAPNNSDSQLLIPSSNHALEETGALEQQGTVDCAIFSEIGTFTSLITSTNDTLQFGFGTNTLPDTSSFAWQHQKGFTICGADDDGDLKFQDNLNGGDGGASLLLDQGTVPIDLSVMQNKTGHGGFGSLDWHGGVDQGLFDLSNTVDHSYWTQHSTHWSEHDNSTLFHLP